MKTGPTLEGIEGMYARLVGEVWTIYQAMRRLGFASGDLYVVAGPHVVAVELRTQGRRFVTSIGHRLEIDPDAFQRAWLDFVERLRSGEVPDADLDAVWEGSEIKARARDLLEAILAKGIVLPRGSTPPARSN